MSAHHHDVDTLRAAARRCPSRRVQLQRRRGHHRTSRRHLPRRRHPRRLVSPAHTKGLAVELAHVTRVKVARRLIANARPRPTVPNDAGMRRPPHPPEQKGQPMTDPGTLNATITAAAELTAALADWRIIPVNTAAVHDAATRLRTTAAGTDLSLIANALADAAEHRVDDATLDTQAADDAYDNRLDRFSVIVRIEKAKQLDAIDVTKLPSDQVDQVAAAYRWVDAEPG